MEKKCDLHIHSTFSDSDAKVEDIFKLARDKGISCIAICDHDTVDSVETARLGSKNYNIELIESIEISAAYKDKEIHILGYFIDPRNKKLRDALTDIKDLRRRRLLEMVEKLAVLGLNVDAQELMEKIGNNVPTRLHLGLHLVEKGAAKTLGKAFKKYLSPGGPVYVPRFKYSVKEVVGLIKAAGGLAFIAHPQMLAEQSWIDEFISLGIDGMEVVYPHLSEAKSLLYQEKTAKRGLLKSGGSDAHGTYKKHTNIGEVTIPYEWVEEMKERLIN